MKIDFLQDIINSEIAVQHLEKSEQGLNLGRIFSEHRDRYKILTEEGVVQGELLGNLRYTAESRKDLPAVGDWVALSLYDDDKGLIHHIYPRTTVIERQAAGKEIEKQIIATNIDAALIVTSCGRDFNPNRIERYLTICYAAGVTPIVVISKIDLVEEEVLQSHLAELNKLKIDLKVFPIDNLTNKGIPQLTNALLKGKTYCLMGSSGVGKSTLINSLSNSYVMETRAISDVVNKGKHTTSHRELIYLPNGAIIMDNPGMREVGITESDLGIELTFDDIQRLAVDCKYSDCTHVHEQDCAVIKGLEEGEIEERAYENYIKMLKEKNHFEQSLLDKKKIEKKFGRMMKEVKKVRKERKY